MNLPTDSPSITELEDLELMSFLEESPVPLEVLDQHERVKQKLADWLLQIPYYKQRQEADPSYLDSLVSSFVNI